MVRSEFDQVVLNGVNSRHTTANERDGLLAWPVWDALEGLIFFF